MSGLSQQQLVGVVGAGVMGAGIAQLAADSGHEVVLFDADAAARDRAVNHIRNGLNPLVERGRKTEAEVGQLVDRIHIAESLNAMKDCDLIIEAIAESLAAKQELLLSLETICSREVILATNTSSISITALASSLQNPERLVGMHFFNPAPIMKLVEVISGLVTDADVAETIFDTAINWGKKPVYAKSSPGFIVNRVARPFYGEALRLLQESAAEVAAIDALFKYSGGFRMGPFELMDLIGNDVNQAVTESVYNAFNQDARFEPSLLQEEMVAAGLLGRKTGRGWYDYENPSTPGLAGVSSEDKVSQITVQGDVGVAESLLSRAGQRGIEISREPGDGVILVGNVCLSLSDGRTASLRSNQSGGRDWILFDLVLDFAQTQQIAIARSPRCDEDALLKVAGFFNTLGIAMSEIDDTPGLCLMRTVCMLANEGADAVYQGVCGIDAVDTAMQYGVNYPRGPLQWADEIGLPWVKSVLNNLQQAYGLDRYRCSLLINRKVEAGENFYA